MAWTKLKLVAGLGVAALLLASGGVAVVRTTRPEPDGFSAAEIGKKAREKYDSITSYRETGSVVSETDGITGGTATFTVRFGRPDYYRVEWEQKMGAHTPNRGAVWSAGDGPFLFIGGQRLARTSKMDDDQKALASGAGLSSSANTIPATFLKLNHGDALAAFASGQDMARGEDEIIGGVNCYVITYDSTPPKLPMKGKISGTITLWIGKADFLIRRQRFTTDGVINVLPNGQLPVVEAHKVVTTETHENIVLNEAMTPADFKFDAPPNTKAFETRAN
jgi:outer membrane lipoprotein-sorting protein